MYLIGEPAFDIPWRNEFFSPVGQVQQCLEVLDESQTMSKVATKMREEYEAIVRAMTLMGIDFRLVCRDINRIDENFVVRLVQKFGCRLAGFPGFSASTTLYPRDFCTVFQTAKLLLANPRGIRLCTSFNREWRVAESVYGEGGRILYANTTALVGERLMQDNGKPTRLTTGDDLSVLLDTGIQVGQVPLFLSAMFGYSGCGLLTFNDHIDRIGCLITSKDGLVHLILDPAIQSVVWTDDDNWQLRATTETLDSFRKICEPLGIFLHTPKTMRVPYSLNLLQINDGRVLMTSGDPDVEQLVAEIVGQENVYTTKIPIQYYPTWTYAGIRCLVSEAPEAIMKRVYVRPVALT